jgi:hypothetical protein
MENLIADEGFKILFQPETHSLKFEGTLRLNDRDKSYESLVELLDGVANSSCDKIILDLQELRFLNSLGIGVISKFVIHVRNRSESQLMVVGSRQVAWQSKLLRNLIRLMPSLESNLI